MRARLATRLAALRTCAGDSCLLKPDVKPRYTLKRDRSGGQSCVRPRMKIEFEGAEAPEVALAEFYADGELVADDENAPFKYRFSRQELDTARPSLGPAPA